MEEKSGEEGGEGGERSPPSLPGLLSALALGARSVNSLPLGKTEAQTGNEINGFDESEDNEDEDDEFAYQMAFPEFSSLCLESRSKLASMLNQALQSTATITTDAMVEDYEFDDPRLWESAAEACDLLLERVDVFIQKIKEGRAGLDDEQIHEAIGRIGNVARNKAKGGFDQMMGSLVEMEVSLRIVLCMKSLLLQCLLNLIWSISNLFLWSKRNLK